MCNVEICYAKIQLKTSNAVEVELLSTWEGCQARLLKYSAHRYPVVKGVVDGDWEANVTAGAWSWLDKVHRG